MENKNLYESIMQVVSSEVKKALNEYEYDKSIHFDSDYRQFLNCMPGRYEIEWQNLGGFNTQTVTLYINDSEVYHIYADGTCTDKNDRPRGIPQWLQHLRNEICTQEYQKKVK